MSGSKRGLGSDLAKVDAYVNTPEDYEEIPELDDDFFERATVEVDGKPVRGRPPIGSATKQRVTLRLDPTILAHFRASGAGWQARMNDFLARNEPIVEMIENYERDVDAMQKLLEHVHKGELRATHESAEATIAGIERNIAVTRETVRSLREVLVWEPQPARP